MEGSGKTNLLCSYVMEDRDQSKYPVSTSLMCIINALKSGGSINYDELSKKTPNGKPIVLVGKEVVEMVVASVSDMLERDLSEVVTGTHVKLDGDMLKKILDAPNKPVSYRRIVSPDIYHSPTHGTQANIDALHTHPIFYTSPGTIHEPHTFQTVDLQLGDKDILIKVRNDIQKADVILNNETFIKKYAEILSLIKSLDTIISNISISQENKRSAEKYINILNQYISNYNEKKNDLMKMLSTVKCTLLNYESQKDNSDRTESKKLLWLLYDNNRELIYAISNYNLYGSGLSTNLRNQTRIYERLKTDLGLYGGGRKSSSKTKKPKSKSKSKQAGGSRKSKTKKPSKKSSKSRSKKRVVKK